MASKSLSADFMRIAIFLCLVAFPGFAQDCHSVLGRQAADTASLQQVE
jgi:hypothetical protein